VTVRYGGRQGSGRKLGGGFQVDRFKLRPMSMTLICGQSSASTIDCDVTPPAKDYSGDLLATPVDLCRDLQGRCRFPRHSLSAGLEPTWRRVTNEGAEGTHAV